jgi:quinoprotein glucose dehydrogenase
MIILKTLAAVLSLFASCSVFAADAVRDTSKGEWPFYAGNSYATKYSPLSHINAKNVGSLEIAWTWDSADDALLSSGVTRERAGRFVATPIMIDGRLYTSTAFNQVAAIDASNGKTLWTFDPKAYLSGRRPANSGWQHRGVAYWEGKIDNKSAKRILIATGVGELIAIDAENGEIVKSSARKVASIYKRP